MAVVNHPRILSRLITKFRLLFMQEESILSLNKSIVLISSVDELLREMKASETFKNISSGSGYTIYQTVPAGKRWKLKFVFRSSTTANSSVVLYINGTGFSFNPTSTSQANIAMNDLILDPGDGIGMMNTGNGADTNIGLDLFYEEEDAY